MDPRGGSQRLSAANREQAGDDTDEVATGGAGGPRHWRETPFSASTGMRLIGPKPVAMYKQLLIVICARMLGCRSPENILPVNVPV